MRATRHSYSTIQTTPSIACNGPHPHHAQRSRADQAPCAHAIGVKVKSAHLQYQLKRSRAQTGIIERGEPGV